MFFRTALFLGALGSAALPAMCSGSLPLANKKWIHVRSENFELWSRSSVGESRRILTNFELVRAVFQETFKFPVRRPSAVTIVNFSGPGEMEQYVHLRDGKPAEAWGVMLERPDRPVIMMYPEERDAYTRHVVFHEYIHEMIRSAEEDPPAWLDEGLAEVFASIEPTGEEIVIGRPHPSRVALLQRSSLIPLAQLFQADRRSHLYAGGTERDIFYSQSWALVHFWLFGQKSFPREKAFEFINAVGGKAEAQPAFEAAFGMDYRKMEKLLDGYVAGGKYGIARVPRPKVQAEDGMAVRPVTEDEISFVLTDLLLRTRDSAQSQLWLIEHRQKFPEDPRPWEALGAVALMKGDEDDAREKWAQALALGSKNPTVLYRHTMLEVQRWLGRLDFDFRLPADLCARLRERLLTLIEKYPEQRASYEALALVESCAQQPSVKNFNFAQRKFRDFTKPQKQRALLALAHVRWRLENREGAKEMLALFEASDPPAHLGYAGNSLRRIMGLEVAATGPAPSQPRLRIPLKVPE
jgi:hypothetical protein